MRNQTARNQTVQNHSVRPNQQRHPARRGFTLLELLVAIVVIAVLAAFLLPAIQGIVGTAKDAAVRNEISQLESAIATFKQKYGIEPPSSIVLCENDALWTANQASKTLIQRMWPNFKFDLPRDFNHNGNTTEFFALNGTTSLVFFLGGMPQFGPGTDGQPGVAGSDDDGANGVDDALELGALGSDDSSVLAGFSKDPTNPFATPKTGEVREGPYFEFVPSRLKASGIMPAPAPADFRQYLDPLSGQTSPYLYLSSYDGRGYVPTDIPAATNLSGPYLLTSGGTPHKAKSFQIISPGADTLYSNLAGSVVYDTSSSSNNGLGTNTAAYDNITNFASGRLRP